MTATLLVLDGSTETLHVGLMRGPDKRWLRALAGGASASLVLLPGLLQLLRDAGVMLRDVDAIGVGCGPGAFTGVRAACAAAQGLACGAGRPVLLLGSLMAVAEDARQSGLGDELWVATDARIGEVYAARYRHDGQRWQEVVAPSLWAPSALAARVTAEPLPVAGSSLQVHREAWRDVAVPQRADAAPCAAALLSLAQTQWLRGQACDAAQAQPLYVRDKVAQTTAERRAAQGRSPAGLAAEHGA